MTKKTIRSMTSACVKVWLKPLVLACGFTVACNALANDFPSETIRLISPAPPGGGTDGLARIVANGLAESARWTVVVENLPGAGGNIGFEKTFRATKDGHTLALGESSNMIVNQFLYKRIPFNIEKDMQPVTLVARIPLVLIVSADSPHRSIPALLTAGKAKPLLFASPGNGTLAHVSSELWATRTGVPMNHVPYKGAAPAMTDLIGGQTDFLFASIPLAQPMISSGKVRALAVASPTRLPLLPDVPTMAESGFPGMEASVVYGVVGPSGMPAGTLAKLNAEINKVLARPSVAEKLVAMGADRRPGAFGGDPTSFQKLLKEEREKWAPVIRASGASID